MSMLREYDCILFISCTNYRNKEKRNCYIFNCGSFCVIVNYGKSQVSQMDFKEKNIFIDEYLCLSDFLAKKLARNKKSRCLNRKTYVLFH